MKISYSHVHAEIRREIDDEAKHHIEKLGRLLKRYDPDLVQLHGSLEQQSRTDEFSFSLNLTLPTGSLQATGKGVDIRACAKAAFADIEAHVKKHQEKLRKDYVWKRKRGRGLPKLGENASTN
jgi:ribosome-associated translation inhibitor RaiA